MLGGKQLTASVHSFLLAGGLESSGRARVCPASSLLALAWRGRSRLFLACVGPAYTVQVWVYKEDLYDLDDSATAVMSVRARASHCVLQTIYYEHTSDITVMAWSPVTLFIASASDDGSLRVWDAWTGKTYLSEQREGSVVRALAWSPDGCWLAVGYDDNSIRVLDVATAQVVASYAGPGYGCYGIDALAWSPDGRRLAAAGDDARVHIWDMRTGCRLMTYEGHRERWALVVAWSPDGRWLASGGDDVHIWNATSGRCRQIYSAHEYTQNWIDALVWSPDGCTIATASTDRTLNIWYVATARTLYTQKHPETGDPYCGLRTNSLAWLVDTERCLSATNNHVSTQVGVAGRRAPLQRASCCLAFASCDKTVSLIRLPIEE